MKVIKWRTSLCGLGGLGGGINHSCYKTENSINKSWYLFTQISIKMVAKIIENNALNIQNIIV